MKRPVSPSLAGLAVIAAALLLLPSGSANNTLKGNAGPTFTKDVAPILFKSCAECHRPGEAAPFSLLSYKDARPWAKSIREKVLKREMPPWHADPKHHEFSNDRRLPQSEIDTIAAWVDSGAKEGDPKDLPPAPKFVDGWTIGKPDVVIPMPEEFTLEASGPDEYQYFEVQTNFKEDVFVQSAEARPGNRKIVHHIIAFVVPPRPDGTRPSLTREEIEKRRAQAEKDSIRYKDGFLQRTKQDAPVYDDGCSLPSGGNSSRRDGGGREESGLLLAGYAPGMNQAIWMPGTIKRIPVGSKIMFQLHYSKVAGSVQKDRSSIGLIFAKKPPEKELNTHAVANGYFVIPPGSENHKVTACWMTDADIHVVTAMPHMHLRGKAMEIRAFLPDGREQLLLNVPNYSFSWQEVYYFKEPPALPKGTKIQVTGYFDNSAKNKFNPDPTKAVRWGDPTYDEMMIGWIDYTVDNKSLKPATAMK
jgi:mono/diheme cytochrome c family protein